MRRLDPTLTSALSIGLEQLINRTLSLDPAAQIQLNQFAGRILVIQCDQPSLRCCVQFQQGKIALLNHWDDPWDSRIRGGLADFLAWHLNDVSGLPPGLSIEGNVQLALQLQSWLQQLDLDWEAELAKYLGDLPAHFIGQRLRSLSRQSQYAHQRLRSQLQEYLQEELGILPSPVEIDTQLDEIDGLRLATDRLGARLARLQSQFAALHRPAAPQD